MEFSESTVHYEDLLKYITDNINIDECIVEKFLDADEEYLRQHGEIYDIGTPIDKIENIHADDKNEVASLDIDDEIEYISTTQNIDRNLVDDMMFYYSKFLISKDIIDEKEYYNANKWTLPVLSEYIVNKTNIEKSIVDKIIFNSQYVAKFYIYEDKREVLAEFISSEIGISKDIVEKIFSILNDYEIIEF